MKRFALVFSLLVTVLAATPALATWEFVTSGTTVDLNDVHNWYGSRILGDNGTLLLSTDNGVSWVDDSPGTSADLHKAHMPSSSNFWLSGSGGTVLVSTDQGTSWDPRGPGDPTANLRAIFSRSSGLAFAAGDQGKVFYSGNVGQTWHNRHTGASNDLYTGICPTIGGLNAIVAGEGGAMYRTTDAGVNWTTVATGTSRGIHDMIGGPGNSIIAVGEGGLILRSEDFGVTWTRIASTVTADLYGASTSGASSFYVVACGAGGTLIKSTDGGLTWGRLVSPTDADLFDVYGYNNNIWVACGAGGTIIRTIDGGGNVVAVDDLPTVAAAAELAPAYPNPFNPLTNLRFRLEAAGTVRLDVYALDGRLVRSLVHGQQSAGWHVVQWDGRDGAGSVMASGVYLARLSASGQVVGRRMQLVK